MTKQAPIIQHQPVPGGLRSQSRARARLPAIACHPDNGASLDCIIRNLSPIGAGLHLPSLAAPLPGRFHLISVKERAAYDAEIVWRNGTDIGVIWRAKISITDEAPEYAHLRRLLNQAVILDDA